MSKLSSKLHQNENNSDIHLYQILLSRLNENLVKYYG